jgi:hypothetical protein
LHFDYRSADGQAERLPQLAAELVRTGPDVLIAGFGTLTAKAEGCNHNDSRRLYKRRRSYRRGRSGEPESTGRKCHWREQ